MTSTFYEYQFISAEPLFAQIKEEFKSYFDTGAVDDLLFPIWTKHCLDKLGKGSYKLENTLLFLEDFQSNLPPDFKSVREAWLCTAKDMGTYQLPTSYYKMITTRVSDDYVPQEDTCPPICDPCPIMIESIYKTTTQVPIPSFYTHHLLKPGNISALSHCADDCRNRWIENDDTFDIRDRKFTTNFRTGTVYLLYYSTNRDEEGTDLIPDNVSIRGYIKAYIEYMLMKQLWNQVGDESFNQAERKYKEFQQLYYDALAIAETETKKKTIYQKMQDFKRQQRRLNKYNI